MRRPYIFLLPVLLGQCLDGSMPGTLVPAQNQRLAVTSVPVPLDTSDPDRRSIGAFRFAGAWQLSSDTRSFGGLSALDVDRDRVTALGDGGTIVQFRIGRFGHVSDASIIRLPNGCGKVANKTDNDTEALTHDDARKHWWISYEWRNAVCRTNTDFTEGQTVATLAAISKWPRKKGAESLTRLADGRFLMIAEATSDDDNISAVALFDRDPTDPAAIATMLEYRAPDGFKPTDVAQLPDGRLLVLNRRFALTSLFTAALVVLPPVGQKPSGVLRGPVVARFTAPIVAENFEGLSIDVEDGKPVIWMISDNNFMRWQRTLLLKFTLD